MQLQRYMDTRRSRAVVAALAAASAAWCLALTCLTSVYRLQLVVPAVATILAAAALLAPDVERPRRL